MDLPFRWDITRREQLGRLAAGPEAESYAEFVDDLRACAARVVSFCADSDLVFVGRSPESLFDYLSGVLAETSWRERLSLLNVSVRGASPRDAEVEVLRRHLTALRLRPRDIAERERPIALVDVVSSGGTFEMVTAVLRAWTHDDATDWNAVKRRLRFIGLLWQKHTSPNTWRWHQGAEWLAEFRPSAVRNVSVPWQLWGYIANEQKKVARTQPPLRWRDEEWRTSPPRDAEHLESLRLAVRIYDTACTRPERLAFARALTTQPDVSKPWLRALIAELRKRKAKEA